MHYDSTDSDLQASRLSSELEGVDICVLEYEAEADRLPGKRTDVAASVPRHLAVNFVTELLGKIVETEAGEGVAFRVLDFDPDRADCRGRVVQFEFRSGEGE